MAASHHVLRRCVLVVCAGVAAALCCATDARAQQLKATAVVTNVVMHDKVAEVTFHIEITNDESSAMTNVSVVFEDMTNTAVGDVPAGQTVASKQETRIVDISHSSDSIPVRVTVKVSLDGAALEVPWVLSLMSR